MALDHHTPVLNYDCWLNVASYLDTHTVAYVLPAVSHEFYSVAREPALWSELLVSPCCEDELRWLAGKFSSIRHIYFQKRGAWAASLELVAAVVQMCPNVCHWPQGAAWLSQCGEVSLRSGSVLADSNVTRAYGEALVELALAPTLSSESVKILTQQCPNVRSVLCDRFVETYPTIFPELRSLTSRRFGSPTAEQWADFVVAHPKLHDLSAADVYVPYTEPVPFPSELRSLYLTTRRATSMDDFRRAFLSANRDFHRVQIFSRVSRAELAALQQSPHLKRLTLFALDDDVTEEDLDEFAACVRLQEFRVLDSAGFGRDRLLAATRCLYQPQRLPNWLMRHDCLPGLSGNLSYIRKLEFSTAVDLTVEDMAVLGEQLALHELDLEPAKSMGAEHYEAFAPAVACVRKLDVASFVPAMSAVVASACASPNLLEFVVSEGTSGLAVGALAILVAVRPTVAGTLQTISISLMPDSCPAVRELVRSAQVAAWSVRCSFMMYSSDTMDAAAEIGDSLRVCNRMQGGEMGVGGNGDNNGGCSVQ